MACNVAGGRKRRRAKFSIITIAQVSSANATFRVSGITSYNRVNNWRLGALHERRLMAASKTPPNAKSRVLIADDNPPNVELLEAFLAELDYEICVAVDGHDTLAKVASFQPDLILLDVMMPKLSGFEVCKKLKGDPATRTVMILMVTALNELGDIERAVDSGTDDFLSKPVNKVELIKRVENMLKLRHVTDELERLRRYIQRMEDDDAPGGGNA